jgi:protein SCO1/2
LIITARKFIGRLCGNIAYRLSILIIVFITFSVNVGATSISNASFYNYLGSFDLKTQDDQPLDYLDLKDNLVIVNFIFTHCPSVCPTQTIKLAELYLLLPEAVQRKVKFLSITIDPERDTPAVLKHYALQLNANKAYWTFATGSPENIEAIKKELQLMNPEKAKPTFDDHRTGLWLLNDEGVIMQRYRGSPMNQDRIQKELIGLHRFLFSETN